MLSAGPILFACGHVAGLTQTISEMFDVQRIWDAWPGLRYTQVSCILLFRALAVIHSCF